MAREWTHPSPREAGPRPFLPGDPAIDGDILSFLASSGDADAYRALAQELGKQPIGRRFWVVSAFLRQEGGFSAFGIGPGAMPVSPAPKPVSITPEARRVVEDLLGERLGDQSGVEDVWMSIGGAEVDSRLGHVAARALAGWFPEKYLYDSKASARKREAQRLAAQDLWRAERGLPPAPRVPERPRPALVSDAVVGPAVERLLAAEPGEGREAAAAKDIESLGIGALPALVAKLRTLPEGIPARADLEAVGARLASIVTHAMLAEDSLPADAAFSALLAELGGKPFGGEAFTRLVVAALAGPPNGAVGIRLRVARADDLSGVLVVVALVKDPIRGWCGHEPGWSQLSTSGPNIRVGDRSGGGKGGATGIEYARDPAHWKEDAEEVERAFRAPPDVSVVVGFSAVREE